MIKYFYIQHCFRIYSNYPKIDLEIIDGIQLNNSFDIYTPIIIMNWLKKISKSHNYYIYTDSNNKIKVEKKIHILPYDDFLNSTQNNKNNFNYSNNINKIECPLCCEFETDIITNCVHKFCFQCIRSWTEKNFSCPICRNPHSKIKFYNLANN